ncbi:MAG: hypothetical protein OXL34_18700 [Gemmatimonadota bacterium]|nr:hypothetical protein [Gemmatimonadota bacterium]
MERSDSAGIPISTALAPLWGPGEGWTVEDEPLVRIGNIGGPPEYLLDWVVGAVRLSRGDIVVGEMMSGELRRFDRDGTFVWRAAGRGEGPGEHLELSFLGSLPGDSVVTFDHRNNRLQVFGPDGGVSRTVPMESPWPGFRATDVIGLSERHLVMTFSDYRGEMPVGVVRWPGVGIATYSLDDGSMRELMAVPGGEQHIQRYSSGQVGYTAYEFGKGPRWAVMPGRLAVVDTEFFSIRSVSLDDGSTTAILRRNDPVLEVTSEHVDAFLESMVRRNIEYGGYSREEAEASIPSWRELPMAPTLPVLESIRLDAAGNLWVEPYSPPGTPVPPFDVYSADGAWLGTVAMPPRLELGIVGLEIGEDYVLGVWHGEQDVEQVRMYRLRK